MRLLIATMNPGKVREFREMLGGDRFTWDDLSAHPGTEAAPETGRTFRANACQKATHYARLFSTWVVADDSGLEVDALGGAPGVHSARWAAMHDRGQGDTDNNRLLIEQLQATAPGRRIARFVCVLALADPSGCIILTARDAVEGTILDEPRGDNGFGYDPLFYVESYGRTVAQLPSAEKHRISHRGKALSRLRGLMQRTGVPSL